eukprot:scaffold2059_cov106-Isochrysis_galbana.AAC.1
MRPPRACVCECRSSGVTPLRPLGAGSPQGSAAGGPAALFGGCQSPTEHMSRTCKRTGARDCRTYIYCLSTQRLSLALARAWASLARARSSKLEARSSSAHRIIEGCRRARPLPSLPPAAS